MSKSHSSSAKHMSADAADKFEEEMEGDAAEFGTMHDWEMELGLQIIKIETKLESPAGKKNIPVHNMLTKKLATYNAALLLLDRNAKIASQIGSQGGLQAIIAYITKQAIEDAARAETREYSNMIMEHLPGYKLSSAIPQMGGLVGARAPVAGGRRNIPQINGSQILQ